MKEILKLIGALTLISAVAGLLLAFTNRVTRQPIAEARRQETLQALAQVLPPFDNQPDINTNIISEGGADWLFYVARKGGEFAGFAFVAVSSKGYSGPISLMAGVNADRTVRKIRVLSQQETPGLGTRIAVPPFPTQMEGRGIENTKWAVKKDGGDFDAITGATISSRAVIEAVKGGLDVYLRHEAQLAAAGKENR